MKNTIVYIRTTNIYDDSRATKEILALAKAGYKVVVLGWNRSGNAEKKCSDVFNSKRIEYRFYNVELPKGLGIKNLDKLIGWFRWTKNQLRNISDVGAVHLCNLDSALGVVKYCKTNNIPIFYDIYDYYIDSHSIPKFLINTIERIEIRIINAADVTIICTEERREQVAKATPKKVIVIHNSPEVELESAEEERYDYAYCGSLCEKRLVKEILDGYHVNNDLKVAFAGNDIYLEDTERVSNQYDSFDFFGTIPYSKVLEIEKQAKVLSAIYEPSIRNHRLCAPNKFYEALALGKPLIVCRGTGIDKIVESNNLGSVINYDAGEFYTALRKLCSDPQTRLEMGKRGRKLYVEKYSWTIMREILIDAYSSVLADS